MSGCLVAHPTISILSLYCMTTLSHCYIWLSGSSPYNIYSIIVLYDHTVSLLRLAVWSLTLQYLFHHCSALPHCLIATSGCLVAHPTISIPSLFCTSTLSHCYVWLSSRSPYNIYSIIVLHFHTVSLLRLAVFSLTLQYLFHHCTV